MREGKRGHYIGVLKENQPELKEAVETWIEASWAAQGGRPLPDHVGVDKGHGRLERRDIWRVEAGELGSYLEQEYHWPGVTVCGRIRRRRQKGEEAAEEEELTWIASAPLPQATPAQIQEWLRGHWGIENRVFRVRDVSYDEDRLHGRQIGPALAALRNGAITLIRRLGYAYVPDAWRHFSPCAPCLLLYLLAPL